MKAQHCLLCLCAATCLLCNVGIACPIVPETEPLAECRRSATDDCAGETNTTPWWLDAVGAAKAWRWATGAGVTVAVIDSGVDLTHPALHAKLRADGYNFGDCTPECPSGQDSQPQDALGHGTYVAGIIAGRRDRARRTVGLAADATILPIKINVGMMDDFTPEALALAIDYATRHGARVINLSMDMPAAKPADQRTVAGALQRAMDAGVIVVAASGNWRRSVTFPGSYPGVIAVAGVNADGSLFRGSNIGPEVLVAAPASDMWSTLPGGRFGACGAGTSFAAPLVAATVALLLEIDPQLDRAEVVSLLKASAKPLPSNGQIGFGILDAGQAVALASERRKWSSAGGQSNGPIALIPNSADEAEARTGFGF